MERTRCAARRTNMAAALGTTLILALAAAAPASADDASVLGAWAANGAQFNVLADQVTAGTVAFRRTGRAGRLFGALVRTRALIRRTRLGIIAQQASTPTGEQARITALRSLYYLDRSLVHLYRSVRAIQARRRALALALARRGKAYANRADALNREANALFRRAGLAG